MSVKINKVRDAVTLKQVTTQECTEGYSSSYICITENCNALMSFNPRHERRLETKTIVIEPYFKLKKGQEHTYGICPYNIQGSVDIIAKDSDNNLIKSLDNKKYDFTLQILHTPEHNKQNTKTISSTDLVSSSSNTIRQYATRGVAPTYINTLQKILKLRSILEENNDLAPFIELKYRAESISWSKFYFDENNQNNMFNFIKKKQITYPICICGTVSKIASKTEKFPYNKIILDSPEIEPENETPNRLSIELILANDQTKLENYSNDQQLLAYGITNITNNLWVSPNNPNHKINYFCISIWINHKAQLMAVEK